MDHEVNVGDVQAARCDVGRDQHVERAVAEAVERLLALRLRDVAVQRLADLRWCVARQG
jgi:hypothetical protein